jgi:hypothetical protein
VELGNSHSKLTFLSNLHGKKDYTFSRIYPKNKPLVWRLLYSRPGFAVVFSGAKGVGCDIYCEINNLDLAGFSMGSVGAGIEVEGVLSTQKVGGGIICKFACF